MYKKVPGDLNFVEREREVLKFWKDNDIFEKSIRLREGGPVFTFYDGPPTANGKPHIGHIITRVIKDIIPRYKTMKGYKVLRKAGWDTHGLPVELEVEKSLGIDGKQEVEKFGIENFIAKCKESVWKYTGEWKTMSDKVGYWADMDNPYVTYENNYIESVWWAIKTIADKDLLYKGHKIVPYCPRCGTSLSSHEVAQGYKDVKEASVYVRFPVKGRSNTYFLAWTTTPWTLPSNVALAVNPDVRYIEALRGGETLIMAEALAPSVLGEYTVSKTVTGRELEFMEYEPLWSFQNSDQKAFFVGVADYVTITDGTGIVHTAPAFGEDDAKLGHAYNLPFIQLVDERGHLTGGTKWDGTFVKDADRAIIKDLDESGLLYKTELYEHSYPFCWRCDTPLLYYALDTWFIRMTKLRENLLRNNNSINWLPENIRDGRMGNFLSNVVDWGLSRSRYWGTPLPVWECECGHYHVIGSIEELKRLGENCPEDIELHKPYIDKVTITCEKCGKKGVRRVSEVIDCWFDSGSMPFAQWHYPFENREIFSENFPADFISEAIDQTRGWFYTLLAISTCLFDCAPFKNCIVLGHVNDKDGQKMSKHKGNVVDTDSVLNKQGADAVRWYFYVGSAPWLPSRFYAEAVSESQRKFMGTLWNAYSFYVLYANLDSFDPTKHSLDPDTLPVMDLWILSRLSTLVKTVDNGLESYQITESARAIQDFTDELSNWYIRRGRDRYWGKELTKDKTDAYMTLYTVLVTLAKLAAPFVPFIAEEIYQNLVRSVDTSAPESVHLCKFPAADESRMDADLEQNMEQVLKIVMIGRSARNAANIKNRQPLGHMYVRSDVRLPEDFAGLVLDELNIKELHYIDDTGRFVDYKFKPQLKTVGPKYGKLVGKIGAYLSAMDGRAAYGELKTAGTLQFRLEDTEVSLTEDDLLIETVRAEGFAVEEDGGLTVALDTSLDEALLVEGYVREVTNKLQTMRKEAGFEVSDRILVGYRTTEKLAAILLKNSAAISGDVLADTFTDGVLEDGYSKDWNINGEEASLSVKRV